MTNNNKDLYTLSTKLFYHGLATKFLPAKTNCWHSPGGFRQSQKKKSSVLKNQFQFCSFGDWFSKQSRNNCQSNDQIFTENVYISIKSVRKSIPKSIPSKVIALPPKMPILTPNNSKYCLYIIIKLECRITIVSCYSFFIYLGAVSLKQIWIVVW